MKLYAEQLSSHLKNKLTSCYLVSGDEHLLVEEALDDIRAAARAQGFSSRESHIAMTGFNWSELAAVGANLSLFSDKRLIELRLPSGKPGRDGSAAICEFVENLHNELLLVVITPKLDKNNRNSKWVKKLTASGAHLPIWEIELRELPRWIAARMRRAGLDPDRGAIEIIADRVQGNLLAASQEIEKLRMILGDGAVTGEDVSKAVANNSRFDVYKLVDAAVAGNARRAIRILDGLQGEGLSSVFVLWALTRELRTLAKLADGVRRNADLGAAMKKEFVFDKRQSMVRACVGRHRYTDLYRMLKAAGDADAAAKGQAAGDAWQQLASILLNLSQGERRAA